MPSNQSGPTAPGERYGKGRAFLKLVAFKRHAACRKPLLPSVANMLRSFRQHGISSKKCSYTWPKKGYLFPTSRRSKSPHWTKDTIARQICKARKLFMQKFESRWPELGNGKSIRSHSGRRRAITMFAAADLPPQVGMAYAQITSFRVYKGYVDLSPQDVSEQMRAFDQTAKLGKL